MDTSVPQVYKPPPDISSEARRIWDECQLGYAATSWAVVETVGIWAWFNTEIYDVIDVRGNKVQHITWTSPTNVKYTMSWDAFMHWFRCSCRPA